MTYKTFITYLILATIFSPEVLSQCDSNSFEIGVERMGKIREKGVDKPQYEYCVEIIDTLINNNCFIKGAIFDKVTRLPLKYTNISIRDTIGAVAKLDGTFEFKVPEGKYKIKFDRVGYPTFYTRKINVRKNRIIKIILFIEQDLT